MYWVNVDPPVQIWGLVADVQYKEQQLIESNRILLYTVNILLSKSHNCRTHASLLSVCSACKQWTNPWMPSNMFMTVKDPKRIKSRTKRPISQLTSLTSWKKLSWTVRLSPVRRQCIARGRPILLELNLWELWEWEPTFSETSTSPCWCYWFLYRPGPAECPSWSGPWPNRPSNWSGFFQGTCHEQMS